MKSERLKKFEKELRDLEEWQRLGLVPKKDIEKHNHEIEFLQGKLEEEKSRIRAIKESGDVEEYSVPKRVGPQRQVFQEPSTLPDAEAEATSGYTDANLDMKTETNEAEATTVFDNEGAEKATVSEGGNVAYARYKVELVKAELGEGGFVDVEIDGMWD